MKKLYYVLFLVSALNAGLSYEFSPKATVKDWQFEIQNKSDKALSTTIYNDNKYLTNIGVGKVVGIGKEKGNPRFLRVKGLNAKLPVIVKITDGAKHLNYLFNNWGGKNLYFTYDNNALRPQTGLLKGLSSSTASGLNNKNKVSSKDMAIAQKQYREEKPTQETAKRDLGLILVSLEKEASKSVSVPDQPNLKAEVEKIKEEIKVTDAVKAGGADKARKNLLDQIKISKPLKKSQPNVKPKDSRDALLDQIKSPGNLKKTEPNVKPKVQHEFQKPLEEALNKIIASNSFFENANKESDISRDEDWK